MLLIDLGWIWFDFADVIDWFGLDLMTFVLSDVIDWFGFDLIWWCSFLGNVFDEFGLDLWCYWLILICFDWSISGAECVVCMCDSRDTIILPCRHLCLCNACADSLRYQANNCPICRAPFRALLQVLPVLGIRDVYPGSDNLLKIRQVFF